MHPYVYEPLDVSQPSFRLVRLIQGEKSEIKCNLFHAAIYDADDAIEYEALSYTWGSNYKPHNIEINGRSLSVTKSLLEALQHLRQKNEDRILWIDAICIDQNDHKKRGHQVRGRLSFGWGFQRRIQILSSLICNSWKDNHSTIPARTRLLQMIVGSSYGPASPSQ
jgi:hypothetical protein